MPLIEQFNSTSWSVVANPNPGGATLNSQGSGQDAFGWALFGSARRLVTRAGGGIVKCIEQTRELQTHGGG